MKDAHEMAAEVDDAAAEPKEDQNYDSMNCVLKPVERGSPTFTIIDDYVRNTHGGRRQTNANSLGPETSLELLEVFEATRAAEVQSFTTDPALLSNRHLLWHGSGTGNWGSILKTGLRIAPPEAPSTGWLFDKGLYLPTYLPACLNQLPFKLLRIVLYTTRAAVLGLLWLDCAKLQLVDGHWPN